MNHDMIAAGHPPLRFEMASYEALLPRKHWDEGPRRQAQPDYELQLWAAGRIASADAALSLLESRARQANPWPELAESNCLACHQQLRSERRNSLSLSWQAWNVALVTSILPQATADPGALPSPALPATIERLRQEMQKSYTPDRVSIASLAATARAALRASTLIDENGRLTDSSGRPIDLIKRLSELHSTESLSWEEACEEVTALIALERTHASSIEAGIHARLRRVAEALRFAAPERQWPVVFERSEITMSDILRELDALRRELIQQ